jgi:hypothetical protein
MILPRAPQQIRNVVLPHDRGRTERGLSWKMVAPNQMEQ